VAHLGCSQNLDRQIAALRSEGCNEIYREKASGKDIRNRPQPEKAIDQLGLGDCLVVAEWDRATRSMFDGIAIIERSAGATPSSRCSISRTSTSPHRWVAGSSRS
jgi:DNA invertase Pin-like site-specific DNA recombinase